MMQGATYEGVGFEGKICGVSILRAGEVTITPYYFPVVSLTLQHRPWRPASGRFAGASGLAKS